MKADTVQEMVQISRLVQGRDMAGAEAMLTQVMKVKLESEGGNWMVSGHDNSIFSFLHVWMAGRRELSLYVG